MNRTRKLIGSVVLASVAATSLAANSIQVPLKDDSWVLVGVPGFHKLGLFGAATSDPNDLFNTTVATASETELTPGDNVVLTDDGSNSIANGTLDAPTWDRNITGGTAPVALSAFTQSPYAAHNSNNTFSGSPIYATAGLMVIDGVTSGVSIASMNYSYVRDGNQTSAMRSMYIQSPNVITPDVRINYIALYEGSTFYMRFDGSETTYEGTFNKDNTFDEPLTIPLATVSAGAGDAGTEFKTLASVIDMDLTDNNATVSSGFSALNFLNPSDPQGQTFSSVQGTAVSGVTAGSTIGTFTSLEGNLTAFTWDSSRQEWRFFQLLGDSSTLNDASDFTELETGKAYWMKIQTDSGFANFGTTNQQAPGIILGDDGLDTEAERNATYSTQVNVGWNLMSFGDERLRVSGTGLRVRGLADVNLTDHSGAHTLEFLLSDMGNTLNTARQFCKHINGKIEDNNTAGYTSFDVKCFAGDGNTSMYLMGTKQFTVQAGLGSTIPTVEDLYDSAITGESNGSTSANFFTSPYGSYILAFEPNPSWNHGVVPQGPLAQPGAMAAADVPSALGAKMSLAMPDINSSTIDTIDVNGSTAGLTQAGISATRLEVNTSFQLIGQTSTTGVTSANSAAGSIDMDFDGVDDTIIMASDNRFYIRDHTFMRLFTYNASATVSGTASSRIVGSGTASQVWNADVIGSTTAASKRQLVDSLHDINDDNATTGVFAISIDAASGNDANDTIMFWSTTTPAFDIKENGTVDRLTDTASDLNQTTKGAVEKVWYISAIADHKDTSDVGHYHADGNYSGATITAGQVNTDIGSSVSDLKYNAIWAEDFPTSGPLYTFATELSKNGTNLAAEVFISADVENPVQSSGITKNDRNVSLFTSWQTIDVTRDPSTWYNTTDQFNLFWTNQEKGYWVYVDSGVANPVAITIGSDPVDGTVFHHFDNTISSSTGLGPVHNHFDKTLTVSASGILGGTDTTALVTTVNTYEIFATISGNRVPMFQSGAGTNFTLNLSEYETNGFTAGTTYDITFIATDGIGHSGTASVSVDYTDPVAPTITDNGDGTFNIASTGASYIQLHESNISDVTPSVTLISYSADDNATNVAGGTYNISFASVSTVAFPTTFAGSTAAGATTDLTSSNLITNGYLADIRVIGVDGNVSGTGVIGRDDTNSLFSDMAQAFFAPTTKGAHVLAGLVANASSSNPYDTFPAVMNADGSYSGTTLTLNSGVQIKAASGGSDVTLAYAPITGANVDQVGAPGQLTISGLVTILWDAPYTGRAFYLSFGGRLYAGVFNENIDTLTEITDMSSLTSQTITKP
jgi:hypothetical protein